MKWRLLLLTAFLLFRVDLAMSQSGSPFTATGPTSPVRPGAHQRGVVEVTFDRLPTKMAFHAPCYASLVTENGIEYCNGFAETYDPEQSPQDPLGSFEPGFDDENLYARLWIESRNEARIIVRVRGALVSDEGKRIAHRQIPSGSPHGPGDWVDEWYYIYPDGVHSRHVRIYTGLADRSLPFGTDREPPRVIHEFMEGMVLGRKGRTPEQDIEQEAVTLIRTIGDHSEDVLRNGQSRTFSYLPVPRDFQGFSNANILIARLKAAFRPFVIAMPYGVRAQPYKPDSPDAKGFQVWGTPPESDYTVPLAHLINYAPYRKTAHTIEQVYLAGMVNSSTPEQLVVPLAWSWIVPPKIDFDSQTAEGESASYDPAQKAYVVNVAPGRNTLELGLEADPDYYGAPALIHNPTFVIQGWDTTPVDVWVNGQAANAANVRTGVEPGASGNTLVVWLEYQSTKPARFEIRKRVRTPSPAP